MTAVAVLMLFLIGMILKLSRLVRCFDTVFCLDCCYLK